MSISSGSGNGRGGGNGDGHKDTGRHAVLGGTMAMLRRHGAAFLRQQAGGSPRILELQVTRGCNAHCAWCDAWRAPGNDGEMPDFSALVRRIQPLDVALVGGEPLMRPDLERIVASIRLGTEVRGIIVSTNAVELTVARALRLYQAGVDKLVISIEGLGEENDRTRRRPGLFADIERNLPELLGIGFRAVQLQVTINSRNADQLLDAARFARAHGVRISFTLEGPSRLEARASSRDEKSLERLTAALAQLADLAEGWPHVVSSPEYLRQIVPFLRGEAHDLPPCAAGTAFLRTTPDGWIRPCGSTPPLGHWTAWPFRPMQQDCPGCWSRLRGETQALLGVSRLVELYRSSGATTE
jgi:MoaA/NifB/PqqE/SkfB family radical SAM enzyme